MTRKLLVVFASGLVLSIVFLSLAWVVGGPDVMAQVHDKKGWHFTIDDDDDPKGVDTTRTLALDPARPLEVSAPVELHFTRGDAVAMTISGPKKLVDAVRWENGRLSLGDHAWFHNHTLELNITAPRMPDLVYKGAGEIELENVNQTSLALEMSGAGNIDGKGQVETLTVHTRGAGNVDLTELAARDATVSSAGVGNIDISATGKVDATLSGTGNITLHRKPAELTSRVHGIGTIEQDY